MVISENLYELKFRVELTAKASNPQPMEMDHPGEDGFDPRENTQGVTRNKAPNMFPEVAPMSL
jgi:hypothetical protein